MKEKISKKWWIVLSSRRFRTNRKRRKNQAAKPHFQRAEDSAFHPARTENVALAM
jgi:hypothetical protein